MVLWGSDCVHLDFDYSVNCESDIEIKNPRW